MPPTAGVCCFRLALNGERGEVVSKVPRLSLKGGGGEYIEGTAEEKDV